MNSAKKRVRFNDSPTVVMLEPEDRYNDWLRECTMNKMRGDVDSVIIALQCTPTTDYNVIVKEIGAYFPNTNESVSHFFKPPDSVHHVDFKTDYWFSHFIHGMRVNDGEISYAFLPSILNEITENRRSFTKGAENCQLLERFGIKAQNLDENETADDHYVVSVDQNQEQCDDVDEITNPRCDIITHVENYTFCAERLAIHWGLLLNK